MLQKTFFACFLFVLPPLFSIPNVHIHLLALLMTIRGINAFMEHNRFRYSAEKPFVCPLTQSFLRGSFHVEHISLGEALMTAIQSKPGGGPQ